jgi:hypothetical protein
MLFTLNGLINMGLLITGLVSGWVSIRTMMRKQEAIHVLVNGRLAEMLRWKQEVTELLAKHGIDVPPEQPIGPDIPT